MKYIARCMVDMKDKGCVKHRCEHSFPHEFNSLKEHYGDCDESCDKPCECIPVPLSYYMKEVLKKDEE